jgi:cation transport ATPase
LIRFDSSTDCRSLVTAPRHPAPFARQPPTGTTNYTLLRCLAVAAFAALNVVLMSVAAWASNATDIAPEQRDFLHWLSALIALPGAAYAGPTIRDFRGSRLNLDALLSVGLMLALGISARLCATPLKPISMRRFSSALSCWSDARSSRRCRASPERSPLTLRPFGRKR